MHGLVFSAGTTRSVHSSDAACGVCSRTLELFHLFQSGSVAQNQTHGVGACRCELMRMVSAVLKVSSKQQTAQDQNEKH